MTSYFITGGLGFLGQYIVRAIHDHDQGGAMCVLARRRRPTFLGVEMLDRVEWLYGDITRPETFEHKLAGVDTVIHNAAMVSFRRSEQDAIFETNILGTRNLMDAALRMGCRTFIFISSIAAVGVAAGRVSDETMIPDLDALRRASMYGYTKLVSELELQNVAGRMRVIILNPSLVLGPGSDRIALVAKAARLLPILPMPTYLHSFVDVRDFAQAVVLALSRGVSGERYIVTAHHESMMNLARMTLQVLGKRLWLVPVSGRGVAALEALLWLLDQLKLNPGIRDVSSTNIDHEFSSAKLRAAMGWQPRYSLERSIRDSLRPSQEAGGQNVGS